MGRRTFEREKESGATRRAGRAPDTQTFGPHAGALTLSPQSAMSLQRTAGNSAVGAVIQRLVLAEGKSLGGKELEPMAVYNGEGTKGNLKWNRGGGASGKGKYNTGFWRLASDAGLELHVHFGNSGGLVGSGGIAHHFKRGTDQKGSVGNTDLQGIFGSTVVTGWTKDKYKIP